MSGARKSPITPREADLAAPPRRLARRRQAQPQSRALRLDERDEALAQRHGLPPDFGDDDLAVAGADQPGDLAADAAREIDPAGLVPAPDQPVAPFALHDLRDACRRRPRQAVERVAVEMDDAFGKGETIAGAAEWIGAVERVEIGHAGW